MYFGSDTCPTVRVLIEIILFVLAATLVKVSPPIVVAVIARFFRVAWT